MSAAPSNSIVREAVAGPTEPILRSKREPGSISWPVYALLAVGIMIVAGFGLRLNGLGNVGFAEDEINKLDAVRAYATIGEMCDALRDVWGEYEEVPVI